MQMIRMDRQFCRRIRDLNWAEIRFGLSKGWIEHGIAVDAAIRELSKPNCSEGVVELAGLDFNDSVGIDKKLSVIEPLEDKVDKEKWLGVVLAWVYENKHLFSDPLQIVEETYAEFDYPSSIQHLVRYMPVDGAPKNLMAEWKTYLDNHVYSDFLERKSFNQS